MGDEGASRRPFSAEERAALRVLLRGYSRCLWLLKIVKTWATYLATTIGALVALKDYIWVALQKLIN